jgi:hypothetical protein
LRPSRVPATGRQSRAQDDNTLMTAQLFVEQTRHSLFRS